MSRSAELYCLFDCDLKMSQLACMHRPRYSAIQEYITEHPCSKSLGLRAVCGASRDKPSRSRGGDDVTDCAPPCHMRERGARPTRCRDLYTVHACYTTWESSLNTIAHESHGRRWLSSSCHTWVAQAVQISRANVALGVGRG